MTALKKHEWVETGEPEVRCGKAIAPMRCLCCGVTSKMMVSGNRYGEAVKLIVHDKPFRYVRYDSCSAKKR